jgi:hypothetical protein
LPLPVSVDPWAPLAIGEAFSVAALAAPVAATAAAAMVAESAVGTVAQPLASSDAAAREMVSFDSMEKCAVMVPWKSEMI